jgi:succinoglycan biosynthesis transport protein ExoP
MDLLLLAKVLWRKVWILVAIPVIAAFAAFLFTMDIVPSYKSVSQISTGFTINDQVHLTDEKFNLRDADMRFSNLLNSMNSGIAANLLSYRLLLHDLNPVEVPFHRPDPQTFFTTQKEKEHVRQLIKEKLDSLKPMSSSEPEYQLIKKYFEAYHYSFTEVKDALAISRVPNTDYVQVEYSGDKARLAALAANAFTEEFIRYTGSMKNTRTGESVDFLKQVVDEKKSELDTKLESQRRFKSSNNVLDIQGESGAKITQLTELESQRDLARSNVHRYELTVRQLNEDIRSASVPVSNNSNQRILEIRNKINKVNERYVTGGMKDQRLADSLEALRDDLRIQTENSSVMGSSLGTGVTVADLRSQLKAAEINLQVERENLHMVEAKINSLEYNLSGYATKEASLSAIQKEVDLASQEYLAAVEKYNEAKNRLADANTLRQVLVAVPPVAPETSKRILIVALAAVTSFTLCLFAIVALELMDGSVKTPGKFKSIVGLPLSGSINKIDSRNFNIRTYFNQQNGSEETEMFKSLLRKLRHEIESMNAKVILFTSPKRKDGKTFFMFCLSYVLSLVNKRILIIDTNFKNNSLSQILGRNQSDLKLLDSKKHKLLAAAQNGSKSEADAEFEKENSYDLINPTKYKNIFIVGNAGGGSESPAEILSGRDFGNLITSLADSFDYILLEGAALNDFSDTKELVKYADKVVAVFSAESAVKQLDRETIYYLKSLGKKFGGSVLNRVASVDLKL